MNTPENNIVAARMRVLHEERAARTAALARFEHRNKIKTQSKIAASMLALLALIMANAWAAAHGWGLQ